jgi:glycogen debranching enzyme
MAATISSGESLDVVLAVSATGLTEAVSAYRLAMLDPQAVYLAAVKNSKSLFNGKLSITGPDADFNTGYRWAIAGTDRFIVNTPGVGRSLVAGYATTDYGWKGGHKVNGRPGYAWYFGRDAVWSSFALLDYGDFDRVKTVLELFSRYQDISGKIYHELTTSGIAHYDAADATPLYIALAGKYLHHSGDTALIRKEWPAIKKAIDFCYSTDTDGDHLIENTQQGHGWEEGGDLYGTHTTQYMVSCWAEALKQAAYMARNIGLQDLSTQYENEAKVVLEKLNSGFWNPETKFFNHGLYKDGTYLAEPSVMTAIPLYWGQVSDRIKIKSVVEQLASCNFTTDWGTRIVSEKAKFFAPGGYHTGSVWPLFTGWASLGDYAAANPVQGYSKMMSNLLVYKNWSLGYIEEVLHGTQYKYFGVCRHQAWSETMVIQPAIEGMLGLKPDAMKNNVIINPDFPLDWDSVTVENIRVGSHVFSMTQVRKAGKTILDFNRKGPAQESSDDKPFVILFSVNLLKGDILDKMIINNGEKEDISHVGAGIGNTSQVSGMSRLNEKIHVEVYHSGGIGVLPLVHHPAPGDSSVGLKIISDELIGKKYVVKVEGISGSKGKIRIMQSGKVMEKEFVFPESKEKYVQKDLVFDN